MVRPTTWYLVPGIAIVLILAIPAHAEKDPGILGKQTGFRVAPPPWRMPSVPRQAPPVSVQTQVPAQAQPGTATTTPAPADRPAGLPGGSSGDSSGDSPRLAKAERRPIGGETVALAGDSALEPVDDDAFDGFVPPGGMVVFKIDSVNGEVTTQASPTMTLTEDATKAIARAPKWIRSRLSAQLARHSTDNQNSIAKVILEPGDARYTDEIAFSAATTAPDDLVIAGSWAPEDTPFDAGILIENARVIYEMDALLDYAELVDVGQPGVDDDYYTTVKYKLTKKDGEKVVDEIIELPRDLYYWYVAHGRNNSDPIAYANPSTAAPATPDQGGVFWRTYYAYQDVPSTDSSWLHFVTEHPNLIDSAKISGWGPSAHGYLKDLAIDPLVLARDAKTNNPVLAHFSYPGGQADASVVVTTMPVEQAYEAGHTELLINLLRLGSASAFLPNSAYRVLVLQDRDPWGSTVITDKLATMGIPFDVKGSADLETLDLEAYAKIIVPSAQPRAFYDALAAASARFRTWCAPSENEANRAFERLLEIHGAIDLDHPEDDWCGLVLPGEFTCADQTTATSDSLVLGGYPKLLDYIKDIDVLWDRTSISLGTDKAVPAGSPALAKIGDFATQNMVDRCSELPSYYRGPNAEFSMSDRLVQNLRSQPFPQRVLYLHYGNCGEVQTVLNASARTGLIPVTTVDGHGQDHVWNEFNLGERWTHYEIYRSDGGVRVDVRRQTDSHWVALMRNRADGYVENSVANYEKEVFSVDVNVTDKDGKPVDGAMVLVASPYNKETEPGKIPLVPVMFAWTDINGKATIQLGLKHHVYVQIRSPLGTLPAEDTVSIVACTDGVNPNDIAPCNDSSVGGAVYPLDVAFETAMPAPQVTALETPAGDEALKVTLTAGDVYLEGELGSSIFYELRKDVKGTVDVALVDAANLALAQEGKPYSALRVWDNVGAIDQVSVPYAKDGGDRYLLVSNLRRAGHAVDVSVKAAHLAPKGRFGESAGDSAACGCRIGRRSLGARTLLVLAALTALALVPVPFASRRRKS
ncbi:MAG: transglutaminase domain-containing protein [Pseudomonadota bacterium]